MQEFTLKVHREPMRKEEWTKGSNKGVGFKKTRHHFAWACQTNLKQCYKINLYNYLASFISGTPTILEKVNAQTARNKVLV